MHIKIAKLVSNKTACFNDEQTDGW